ncbi:cation:proton antiporter [Amycolatopsis panacis]|uniref:Cation/H(+) antiporter n=1 Tax=Amycolatopsis panacis TaxID=2340917 RepID=A0A419HJ93_9PSEU|nr:cation:proton antiporter [Amycolatopsis panacis]RJQ75873.1 cation/H(+) antiporter [Amycolatopsis panacis]
MTGDQIAVLLADLAIILLLARICGALARKCGQPPVIGEVVAGILLGPTLFGGRLSAFLFPADVRPSLSVLANVGLALFMFMVGLEVDQQKLRGVARVSAGIAVGSLVLPFGLGVLLALFLGRGTAGGPDIGFVLFVGTAMAMTAFPVLARILTDRGMERTLLGGIALSSAAIIDVLAWCMLAAVVAVAGGGFRWQLLALVPYGVLMVWVVRPLLKRWIPRIPADGAARAELVAVGLLGWLLSAAATEWLGLHFIFGAFLFGLLVPRDRGGVFRDELVRRVGPVTTSLFVPVYFVVAGFGVNFAQLGRSGFGEVALILALAIAGKFAGAFVSARVQSLGVRDSLVLGTLMNVRGMTELVVLGVGLQLGVIDGRLYSEMTAMALVTTAMTGPLLSAFGAKRAASLPAQI